MASWTVTRIVELDLFEAYVKNILDRLRRTPRSRPARPLVTFDEGGGYYDSGYIQPIDFFGDGTRIPLIAVSPYAAGGNVNHAYADHVRS